MNKQDVALYKDLTSKKRKRKFAIVCISVFGGIIALSGTIFLGGNLARLGIYKEFYAKATNTCKIPGMNDGAVQQGLTVANNYYLTSNYMKDGKSPSRIYIVDKSNHATRYVELYEDKELTKPCVRHCGGIQYVNNQKGFEKLYIADANRYILEIDYSLLMKPDTKKIALSNIFSVDNEASSIFSDTEYVYVSEFNRDGTEWTSKHEIVYQGVTHKALISVYKIDPINMCFGKPEVVYSIPDEVQGIAIKNNILYTTSSWGLNSSYLRSYDLTKANKLRDYKDTTCYFIDEDKATSILKCPPMLEELDFDSDGKLITYTEFASNKYILGKIFFINQIYSITVS